jgi:hypothetical protein
MTKLKIFKMAKIPVGVRCIVYSFLEYGDLLDKAVKLSKYDLNNIMSSKLVDQEK